MAEYEHRKTVIEDIPVGRQPVVQPEYEYEHIVHERRGISGAAVAAIVMAAIAAAVLITMMITNSQRESREAALARDRDINATVPAQPTQQQPVVVTVPQAPSQPTTVPVPVPVPVPTASAPSAAAQQSSKDEPVNVEIEITTRLLNDVQLRSHPINVTFISGTATLTGDVPSEELKVRAETVAKTVKGVTRVINDITVR